jgi:hypothetical protein
MLRNGRDSEVLKPFDSAISILKCCCYFHSPFSFVWLVTSSLRSLNLPLSQFLVLDFNFNRYSYLLVVNKKSSTCCSEWSKMVFSFWDTLLWAWILKYFTGLILVCFRHPLLPPYTFFSSALQFYQNIIVHYLSSGYLQKHHTVITSAT